MKNEKYYLNKIRNLLYKDKITIAQFSYLASKVEKIEYIRNEKDRVIVKFNDFDREIIAKDGFIYVKPTISTSYIVNF